MGYAVARSLIAQGHSVACGGTGYSMLRGGQSGVLGSFRYQDPFAHTDTFLDSIALSIRKWSIDVLFPVHEETFVVARHREVFSDSIVLAPKFHDMLYAHDKWRSHRIAHANGIDVPRTLATSTKAELANAISAIGLPVVVKPRFGSGANRVKVIRSLKDIDMLLLGISTKELPHLLVQEYCSGEGVGLGALLWEGTVQAFAGHKRLREIPISGGTSTARVTFNHQQALGILNTFARAMKFNGVAMFEFKFDSNRDKFYFLEINPRYYGGVGTAICSGVDFPTLHLETTIGTRRNSEQPLSTTSLVESRWLLGEIRALIQSLMKGHLRRASTVLHIHPNHTINFDDFKLLNPSAFFYEMASYVRNLVIHGSFGGATPEKDKFFADEYLQIPH